MGKHVELAGMPWRAVPLGAATSRKAERRNVGTANQKGEVPWVYLQARLKPP